jgi:hypothetical protein
MAPIVIDAHITTGEMFLLLIIRSTWLISNRIFLECHCVLDQHHDRSNGQKGHEHQLTYHGILLCLPALVPDFATDLIDIS